MGSEDSKVLNGVPMESLGLSDVDRNKFAADENAPSNSYATLAQHRPSILPAVQEKLKTLNKVLISSTLQRRKDPVYEINQQKGCFYEGEWKNGKQNGTGKIFARNGIFYQGNFVDGFAQCNNGLLVFPDGSHYEGGFKKNQFHGKGVFDSENVRYEGQWENNKPHGHGKQIFKKDKTMYTGEFKDGKKQGKGEFIWQAKNENDKQKTLNGTFKNGNIEGYADLVKGQAFFKGTFQNGYKLKGDLHTSKGIYQGKFQNGLIHDPNGKFTWKTKKSYIGSFQFGELHGKGTLHFPNEQVVQTVWNRGSAKLNNHLQNSNIKDQKE